MPVAGLASAPLMKKTALFLGVGVLALTLFCLGGSEPMSPNANEGNGRYVMFSPQGPNGSVPEIYVIDTQTGRIWRRTIFNDVKGIYMVPLPYLTADQLAATATPTKVEASETQSLQKQYNAEIQMARQRSAASQPASVAPSPQLRSP